MGHLERATWYYISICNPQQLICWRLTGSSYMLRFRRLAVGMRSRYPITMAAWGLIVAVLLAVGSLPFFVGLAVVLPVLGHATWHLYRKVVEPDPNPPQEQPRPPIGHRYAADFPASSDTRLVSRSGGPSCP
jgi:hypothetical protein